MMTLVNSPYSITSLFTLNKAQIRPRLPVIRCSVRVSSSLPSRRIRRRNSLRPKILKTLTKPYHAPLEHVFEKSDYRVVEELETSVGVSEGGLGQLEVMRGTRGMNVMGFKGFPGMTMFKIVASFVGLFVLQTVVYVWIMESRDSSEKDRRLGTEGRYGNEVGLNDDVNELKIAEIRRMARKVREAEKRNRKMENGEGDLEDESGDEEDFETDNSMKNGIAKEIDGRLTMLRKRSSMPVNDVNFLKKGGVFGKKFKNEGLDSKEEYDRLMFEAKRKFRSHMSESGDKPKGFEGINDVREKGRNMNGAKSERGNIGMGKDEEKPVFQSSAPLEDFKKRYASEVENLGKGINSSFSLRSSDSSINDLSKGMNKGANPESGVLQDSSNRNTLDEAHKGAKLKESGIAEIQESQRNSNDLNASKSKMHAMPRRNGKSDSEKIKSKLSRSTNKDKNNNNDLDFWWSTLPCVFAILMQKGHGSEARQEFFTLQINSDTEYNSSYTVAFEDQNDAKNFRYILDSAFEDLPDAYVDVLLMSTKELKEIIGSRNKNVVVARKGEIKLYAGQPLADVVCALRSLVK